MDDESNNSETLKILCCKLPPRRQWIWLYTAVPSTLSCLLYVASLVADCTVAYRLLWTHDLRVTGLTTLAFVYVPVVFTLLLKLPRIPVDFTCCLLATLLYAATLPLIVGVRLLQRVIWTVTVIHNKKPYEEVIHEHSTVLPREVYSYLFLQAFLHSCPQAILQTHLLLLQVTSDKYTEYFQVMSVLSGVFSVAMSVASFHRYEAQVVGGRPAVLLFSPPELSPPDAAQSLLPLRSCVAADVISLEPDSLPGKVLLFFSLFFLIHSRILCLVIAYEIYPLVTTITVIIHFALLLLYLVFSQPTTLRNVPSMVLNAAVSIFALVEVSVLFHKVTLLYVLYFVAVVVEDTVLTVLFFIYSSDICATGILSCDHFGMYTYIIMNSHVIGVIMFIIYLLHFGPAGKPVNATTSTSSVAPY